MITALAIALVVFGEFESWIYHQSHNEEDLYIAWASFIGAGLFAVMVFSGGWR